MRLTKARLALVALAVPLAFPLAAHADQHVNTCTVAAAGTINSFSATCTSAPANDDNGTYAFSITWPVFPCTGVPGAAFSGTASGTTPEGPIGNSPALALISTGGQSDLSIGFSAGPGEGTERHTAMFKFSCPSGLVTTAGGQVSELEGTGSTTPSQPNSAYCPYGQVTGAITYTPPLGASGSSNAVMTLTLTCYGAPGSLGAGTYSITLNSTDTGGCVSGSGVGTISGSGPSGPVSGAWMYGRNAVHHFGFPPSGTGFITMGGHTYGFYLWLDLVPTGSCPYVGGTIVGHGLVVG
jgi:hypothetical protein